MESNFKYYDFEKSFERIDEIIAASDNSFEEVKEIPSRDKLTFSNGYYVDCSALWVDIRGSSLLTDAHTRPKLAKLYRAYISEVVAVMNGTQECAEVNIIGDGISGVFNTPTKPDIDAVFDTASRVASLVKTLNCKFRVYEIAQIEVGIGLSYGRALMVKAGHKGSTINDVIWMGNVVNEAAKLSNFGNAGYSDKPIMVSSVFQSNLNEHNQNLLTWNQNRQCYHGNVIWTQMDDWYKEHCT